jgi:hypothetical protein
LINSPVAIEISGQGRISRNPADRQVAAVFKSATGVQIARENPQCPRAIG